ncbi:MAG: two-component system, NarL family, sensor histidine kinase UhpB [Bradyrhizobium sp.]|jgi:two-component system sensor histidine kinase UhpB|nr:two-component system, NarL family, sensor histidine kinase UhpB [Bradyrhizobium sp.]
MWKAYSLRTRLCIFLCTMFLAALIAGLVLLRIFAVDQLVDESEPAGRSSVSIAAALNNALSASSNPEATLDAFVAELNASGSDIIKFRGAGTSPQFSPEKPTAGGGSGRVPAWFVRLLALPELARHTPILIRGQRVGELVFEPDMAADVYEKWIGFLAILASGAALTLVTLAITYLTVDAALKPLRDLGGGLARLRGGHYAGRIPCSGPPEIRESCEAANELAATLTQLDRENRRLLRKMVSIQDEERRDIARELHDELGPLLFAIRANVIAMVDNGAAGQHDSDSPAQKALQSVEALQLTNRRILDRLRPMHIEEFGLQSGIQKLLRGVRSQAPAIDVAFEIDPALDTADALVTQTVYRVMQEGITNVLRHAQATRICLKATASNGKVVVEISDNGVGMPADVVMGRGLTGMRERVRALGGTFELTRGGGQTGVRCSLPFVPEELETG